MARRPLVCVPFNYDENWIGGVYYVKNLIASLTMLESGEQPDVYVLANQKSSFEYLREHTGYGRLHWLESAQLAGINRAMLSRRRRVMSFLMSPFSKGEQEFDLVFPYPVNPHWRQTACWIPDFQDKHFPELFSAEELALRERQHRDFSTTYRHLVFSSDNARSDFRRFYPEADVETHVLRFAVFEPPAPVTSSAAVRAKYMLPKRFFYAPNQFWIHKNHKLVIEAVGALKAAGASVDVIFSGKEHDHRAPDHVQGLKALARSLGVDKNIRFLGFLPRDDQMAIFREANCIIQPSLFEGWSTVIEDAKSINKYVLAADIPVNREQMTTNAEFFDPYDASALAGLMAKYRDRDPEVREIDYDENKRAFANGFVNLVRRVRASAGNGAITARPAALAEA